MDTKLQQFVEQVATMADIRNVDTRNPIAFDFDFPSMAMRFRVVGSIVEPSYNGYPINLVWVVLDANSPYYKQALQLKSATANDDSVEGRITDVNFQGTWVTLDEYADLMLYPQYYVTGGGTPGPSGPKGDPGYTPKGDWSVGSTYSKNDTVFYDGSSYYSVGDANVGHTPGSDASWSLVASKGDSPTIDYDAIIAEVIARLKPVVTSISLSGLPATIIELKTAQLKVTAIYNDGTTEDITSQAVYSVSSSAGSVSSAGLFTAAEVNADTAATVTATWMHDGQTFTSPQTTTVQNKYPTSVAIAGASSVNESASSTYTATVTYNTGETVALPSSGKTWSASAGAITAAGVFTAPDVSADTNVTIGLAYTEKGVTVNGTKTVSVKNVVVANKARYGVGPAVTNMANYTSAFVNAIANQVTQDGLTNSFNITIPDGQYGYYAHPKSWGLARFEDLDAPGFYGGWDGAQNDIFNSAKWGPVTVVSVTVNGITEDWYVYRTDQTALGATRWSITPTP